MTRRLPPPPRVVVTLLVIVLLAVIGPASASATPRAGQLGIAAAGAMHNYSPDVLARELDGYRAVGARWIRVDVNWNVVQAQGPRSWNWAPFDRVILGARGRGIKVLGMIGYTPAWARPPGAGPLHPPSRVRSYARFAAAVARRYRRHGVHHWEIWNEPNVGRQWNPRAHVGRYSRLLRAASVALKRADRRAFVVSGGLSPSLNDRWNVAPARFLRGMYRNGVRRHIDAVGHHASTFPFRPSVRASWSAWRQMAWTSPSLRGVMRRHGDAHKRIWITEFGAPTQTSRAVSESAQAAMVTEAYALAGRYRWAGPLFWYSFRDIPGATDWHDFCGLLRADFSPKAAYFAYQALARR